MPGFNERTMERFRLQITANLLIKEEDKRHNLTLQTSDISAGGAFFSTEQPLPLGTKVKVDMILPLDELKKIEGKRAKIEVSGAVIRIDDQGMAISFEKNYHIIKMPDEE